MGEVYAAEHIHITKKVAVKLLHPEINSNPEALARFHQEAQSASSIGHDNIVAIDDFGRWTMAGSTCAWSSSRAAPGRADAGHRAGWLRRGRWTS